MKKRILAGFCITCSVVLNAVFIGMWAAHAAPRHFMNHGQCEFEQHAGSRCALQKELSASDSQWSVLKPGIESYHETASVICREIAKNRAALVDELEKNPTDSAALSSCKKRIVACQGTMQDVFADHILREKKMLTPDQRRRFFDRLRAASCAAGPTPGVRSCERECGQNK
jgi:hypothetical protein